VEGPGKKDYKRTEEKIPMESEWEGETVAMGVNLVGDMRRSVLRRKFELGIKRKLRRKDPFLTFGRDHKKSKEGKGALALRRGLGHQDRDRGREWESWPAMGEHYIKEEKKSVEERMVLLCANCREADQCF